MNLLRSAYNTRSELERNLRVNLIKKLTTIANPDVRKYIQMCFDQSVQFLQSFLKSPIEISPLTGFYSILNLSKVYVILQTANPNISEDQVHQKFRSHGAKSTTIDKVKIMANGTFIHLSRLQRPSLSSGNEYTLLDLYRNVPDLKDLLDTVFSASSNFVEVIVPEDFSATPFRTTQSITEIGLMVPISDRKAVEQVLGAGWHADDFEGWTHFRKDIGSYREPDKLREYYELFSFSMDRHFYLNVETNPDKFVPELCAIYLILLKYSSLVRYRPKNWKEKIESDELVIINKFCDQCVLKFWSIVASIETGAHEYVV